MLTAAQLASGKQRVACHLLLAAFTDTEHGQQICWLPDDGQGIKVPAHDTRVTELSLVAFAWET